MCEGIPYYCTIDVQGFKTCLLENRSAFDGDLPWIWLDRKWHPQTRQEIYSLIWVSNLMGRTLPRLALERIAFWIQLIELAKEFRHGSLLLQMHSRFKGAKWIKHAARGHVVELSIFLESVRDLSFYEGIWHENHLKHLQSYLDRKDRFRIVLPHRQELNVILENFKQVPRKIEYWK
jgi:hypothetical protein